MRLCDTLPVLDPPYNTAYFDVGQMGPRLPHCHHFDFALCSVRFDKTLPAGLTIHDYLWRDGENISTFHLDIACVKEYIKDNLYDLIFAENIDGSGKDLIVTSKGYFYAIDKSHETKIY